MNFKFLAAAVCSCLLCLNGCRIVTVQEYQDLQAPEPPFLKRAVELFDNQLTNQIKETALPLGDLLTALSGESDFAEACNKYGMRHAQEQQCNFPVKAEGTITGLKTNTRRGTFTIADVSGNSVRVQIGPVIMGTSLRDIQKGVTYADFNDQTIYGDYGERVNARSVEISSQHEFKEGMHVTVYGAFSSWDFPAASSIQIAPVAYEIK